MSEQLYPHGPGRPPAIPAATLALADPAMIEARGLLREGRLELAERRAEDILRGTPCNGLAHCTLGEIALRRCLFMEAERHFLRATEHSPGYLEALHGLGFARYKSMRLGEAVEPVARTLELDPTNMPARLLRAALAAELGDHETALALYRGIVADRPELVPAWLGLGHSERILGRVDQALAAYRQALRIDPRSGNVWGQIANIKTFTFSPEDICAMQKLAGQSDLLDHDQIFLQFALGKAFYDAGDDRAAFHHYETGNALAKGAPAADAAHDMAWQTRWIDRQVAAFPHSSEPTRTMPGNSSGPRPIFIVGLPRSGTTLVEQILGSHSLIEATSELPYMNAIAYRLDREGGDLSRIDRYALRAEYFSQATAHRHTDRPWFIDKMPSNFAHVPLIRALFPDGAIIDVRRHPLASCVSVFRQHLIAAPEYAGSLADIAEAWRFYAETMSRFHAALPGAVHRLHYEYLIEDTGAEVTQLLAHVGVPFEDACLRWYEGERAVRTPSSEQVRLPIFRKGLDAWRRFEAELGAAREILAAEIASYPANGLLERPG